MLTKDQVMSCEINGMTYTKAANFLNVKITALYNFCKRNNICLKNEPRGGANVKDITGEKFGSLTVIKRSGSKGKLAMWECLCICGNIFDGVGSDLRQGKIKTCGCKKGIKSRRNWQGYENIPKTNWSNIVNNASQRGIEFQVTIEELNSLWIQQKQKCALSGMEIKFEDNSASLDRINSKVGYFCDNIQWVHKDINKIKSILEQDYFIKLCDLVHNHRKSSNESAKIN